MSGLTDIWLDEHLPKYELLGKYVTFILENLLQQNSIDYLSISYRTKTREGVLEKIERKKYKNPMSELMDFSGVRIILYFESDISRVCEIIRSTFNVDENNSIDNETRLSKDKIGYRSMHFVCDIGQNRGELAEYEYISNLKCEVQLRTMLQHAWAELTHDRNYKLGAKLPMEIERKINLYSGMLELADQGFSEIIDSIKRYQEKLSSQDLFISEGLEFDFLSVLEFVKQVGDELGVEFDPMTPRYQNHSNTLINELHFMKVNGFKELKALIPSNYADVYNSGKYTSNALGFIRDLLLLKDFRKLSHFPNLNWTVTNSGDDEDINDNIEYYSNFMSENNARELVRTFS